MGMSASQARLLSLQARQSNLEYQGQQINQERTILSQQCTALYNSLLSMTVPTPPATTDYQTIKYSGELGATKYSFDANSIKPNGTGDTYTITMQEQKHGDSLQKNATIAMVDTNASGSFKGQTVDITSTSTISGSTYNTGNYTTSESGGYYMVPVKLTEIAGEDGKTSYSLPDANGTYYTGANGVFGEFDKSTELTKDSVVYKKVSTKPSGTAGKDYHTVAPETKKTDDLVQNGIGYIQRTDISKYYIVQGNTVRQATENDFKNVTGQPNVLQFKDDGTTYVIKSDTGTDYQVKGDVAGVTVGGNGVHELTSKEREEYADAIANCGLKDANGDSYGLDDFYMYYNEKGGAVFVLKSDVHDGNNNAITYSYAANGEFTKNQEYNDAKLTFDPTNGRITEIAIPNYDDDGNVASWTSISVKAETVTDEAAYNDAYAQYEYDTYLYDQKNKEINAKTEVIQQEDKNLELKLQRLDNERTQITTEIEAVKKVINDNIEGSYKTFSG